MSHCLTAFLLLCPVFAKAHGTDFLLAKLTLAADELRLEITADCEGNPMIADRAQAAAILPAALQIHVGEVTQGIAQLGDVRLEDRAEFDETAPLPPGTIDNSVSHQLLTALWHWKPTSDSVRISVPKGSKHDVLLWIVDPTKPNAEPRWMMLLGGDVTPPILMPGRGEIDGASPTRWWMIGGGAALVAALFTLWIVRRRGKE